MKTIQINSFQDFVDRRVFVIGLSDDGNIYLWDWKTISWVLGDMEVGVTAGDEYADKINSA